MVFSQQKHLNEKKNKKLTQCNNATLLLVFHVFLECELYRIITGFGQLAVQVYLNL